MSLSPKQLRTYAECVAEGVKSSAARRARSEHEQELAAGATGRALLQDSEEEEEEEGGTSEWCLEQGGVVTQLGATGYHPDDAAGCADFTQSPVELLNNAPLATPLLLHRGRLGGHAHPSCHLAWLFNGAHTWLASVNWVITPQPQERSRQPAHEQESVSHAWVHDLLSATHHVNRVAQQHSQAAKLQGTPDKAPP
jgi:hypothetical protein